MTYLELFNRTFSDWSESDPTYFKSKRNAELKVCDFPTHREIHFMGTTDPSDWFYNFLFLPIPFKHLGFLLLFNSLKKKIEENIARDKPTVFVGFSQGAAIALLASSFYGYTAYAFASPRPFFLFGKAAPGSLCIRSRHDLVQQIPYFFHHGAPSLFVGTAIGKTQEDRHMSMGSLLETYPEASK